MAREVLIDTHCHLDLPQFQGDRDQVLMRARDAGVRAVVVPGIHLESSREAVALAAQNEGVYAAVGVHPNECAGFDAGALSTLRIQAASPKVVAIGEIGLDYHWERTTREDQKRALRAQLGLAAETGLPVILHSRESSADLLCELAQWIPELRKVQGRNAIVGVWHAFSGDEKDAARAYELGLVLGLGGPVTFENARRLRSLVPQLDLNRLLLETDAPYLAPHPYRGKRNEPAHVGLVADALAELYGIERRCVIEITTSTALKLFRIGEDAL